MSFAKARAYLDKAYEAHGQLVFMQETCGRVEVIGERPEMRRRVPVISGPMGVGKTSCVREFAAERGLKFVAIDCSFTPASHFAALINNACVEISQGATGGCVILIENFSEADDEWKKILEQYARGRLDTNIMVADESRPGRMRPLDLRQEWIPEEIFIVGEETTR